MSSNISERLAVGASRLHQALERVASVNRGLVINSLVNPIEALTAPEDGNTSADDSPTMVSNNLSQSDSSSMWIDVNDERLLVDVYGSMAKDEQDNIVNITREYPFDYANIMFGYIMPLVLVLTIVTNTLVVMVLAQRHMRTPTNIVLFAMAIVDLLTLLAPSPWYFYTYTLGYHDKFLYPPGACYIHHIMTDVIPVFFHTASIWLALLLAGQRYIYVCHPTIACTRCTVPRVKKAIIGIMIVSFLHQLPRFFDSVFNPVHLLHEGQIQQACRHEISRWVYTAIGPTKYYVTYYGFRILFVNIGPCTALITLNCLLFRALRKAEHKRTRLFKARTPLVGGVPATASTMAATPSGVACRNSPSNGPQQQKQEQKKRRQSQRQQRQQMFSPHNGVNGDHNNNNNNDNDDNDDNNSNNSSNNNNHDNSNSNKTTKHHPSIWSIIGGVSIKRRLSIVNNNQRHPRNSITNCNKQQHEQTCEQLANDHLTHTTNTTTLDRQDTRRQSRRTHDSNRTTLMLIVVVSVFLVVEIPVACSTIAHVVLNSFELFKDVEYHNLNYIKLCTNFLIMLSYPVNFGVYCSMSRKFRQTFKDLFIEGNLVNRRDNSSRYSVGAIAPGAGIGIGTGVGNATAGMSGYPGLPTAYHINSNSTNINYHHRPTNSTSQHHHHHHQQQTHQLPHQQQPQQQQQKQQTMQQQLPHEAEL